MRAVLALVLVLTGRLAHAGPGDEAKQAFLAGRAAADRGENEVARQHYERGVELARKALNADPNDAAGLLWYAGNIGSEALLRGKLFALKVVPEIEKTLLKLEQLHPEYDNAAAARSLARLYHKAPSVISVGSSKKAADYYERALRRAPEYPGNLAFAAEFFAEKGQCDRALPLARKLKNAKLEPYGEHDMKEWRKIADDVIEDECD